MAAALDDLDRNILAGLQEDSSLPLDEIARTGGASKTPVWNRSRKMKASGLIKAEVAIVDPEKLGLESCFFVVIRTSQHDAEWLDRFERAGVPCAPIHSLPEAVAHPQVQALGILQALPGADVRLTGLPFTVDGERPLPRSVAPRLGEHNARHGLPPID